MTTETIGSKINRGVSLLSLSIVLAIVLIAAPIGMERYANYMDQQVWVMTGAQVTTVEQGGVKYIKDNYSTIINQVKDGGVVTVTGQNLLDRGFLPAGFSTTNNFGQNYILAITKNPKQSDKLMAFVLTSGGKEINFKGLRYISQSMPGLGGYVYPENMAKGAGGGWEVNLSSLGLSAQRGHIVSYLTSDALAGGAEESDRLYRYAVNGRPELNRMHTAIDMNKNNINNAGTINSDNVNADTVNAKNIKGGDVNAENGAFNQRLKAGSDITSEGGWLVTKGNFGWQNSTWGGGFYMSDGSWIRTVNNKGIYTGGQVKAGSVDSAGRLRSGEFLQLDGDAREGTPCSPNKMLGFDAAGNALSCQSGVWKSNSGSDFNTGKPGSTCGSFTYCNRDNGYAVCAPLPNSDQVRVATVTWDKWTNQYLYKVKDGHDYRSVACQGIVWLN